MLKKDRRRSFHLCDILFLLSSGIHPKDFVLRLTVSLASVSFPAVCFFLSFSILIKTPITHRNFGQFSIQISLQRGDTCFSDMQSRFQGRNLAVGRVSHFLKVIHAGRSLKGEESIRRRLFNFFSLPRFLSAKRSIPLQGSDLSPSVNG